MESLQEMFYYVGSGLFVAIFMLWIVPNFVWGQIARLPFCSPNWISFWSVPIAWLGFAMLISNGSHLGFLLVVVGYVLDRIDGKMAAFNTPLIRTGPPAFTFKEHWLYLLKEFNHPGSTETGGWFDPAMDKLRSPPMILILAFMGYFSVPIAIGILVVAAFSFFMRPPCQLIPDRYISEKKATGFGKYKISTEFTPMILTLPLVKGWDIQFPLWTLDALLGLALLLGILSVVSRFQFNNKAIKGLVDQVNQPFKHVD